MSREYIVTVPIHGYVQYVVDAESGAEALSKVDDQRAGYNEDVEITWIGKAREARETENSKIERGAAL